MKICIWDTASLPQTVAACAEAAKKLPFGSGEADRIARFHNAEAARSSLGALLALDEVTRELPRTDLTVTRREGGKPCFANGPRHSFNLTHSGSLSAAVLSEKDEGEVGVDLEILSSRRDVWRMADRFFDPSERDELRASGAPLACFYRLWTKKEATAKLCGKGLSALLGDTAPPPTVHTRYILLTLPKAQALLTLCSEHPARQLSVITSSKEIHWMEYRIEHDSMGEVRVPSDRLWGAQTQRSLENFPIGTGHETMPREIIHAFGLLKLAAARANHRLRPEKMTAEKLSAIEAACLEIIAGMREEEFPLVVWQTGSGTQTNMNVNEVVANLGNAIAKKKLLHPNDDVNMSQSSNDTFPTAMHIAALLAVEDALLPATEELIRTLLRLESENTDAVKSGRTHLQDATPIRFSQEISGWRASLERDCRMLKAACEGLCELALGGTAVGTGLNAPAGFDQTVADMLSQLTGKPFVTAENKFHALTSKDELVFAHGGMKALAADMMKIANDVRWLASGPRNGLGEIHIPENEPGSSIMPGKVNPTQCEAVTMVALQVMANDVAVGMAASQGNFELNVFMPVCIYNFLQSARLLSESIRSFRLRCAEGIVADREKMKENLHRSLMLVTALNPHIGYENAARVAKLAYAENLSLKEACVKLGFLSESEFDLVFHPEEMA